MRSTMLLDRLIRAARTGASAVLLAVLAPVGHALEEPAFELLEADGDFELRRYADYHIVSAPAGTAFEDTGDIAFRPLFRYISGANTGGNDIPMTAPVLQTRAEDDWRLAFVVPAAVAAGTIPAPVAPGLQIETVTGGLYGVQRFSGGWGEERFMAQELALAETLKARGYAICGPTRYARYDPPFKPSFLRRNEILVPIAHGACSAQR
jgi:hypothetical protein